MNGKLSFHFEFDVNDFLASKLNAREYLNGALLKEMKQHPIFTYLENRQIKWTYDNVPDSIILHELTEEDLVGLRLVITNQTLALSGEV